MNCVRGSDKAFLWLDSKVC